MTPNPEPPDQPPDDPAGPRPAEVTEPPLADALHDCAIGQEELPYARFPRRLAAMVMDLWILGVAVAVVSAALAVFGALTLGFGLILVPIVIPAVLFGLTGYAEASEGQASLGKTFCDLVVTDLDGQPITMGQSLVRFLVRVALVWVSWEITIRHFSNGWFLMPQDIGTTGLVFAATSLIQLFTPRRQALHDLVAGTLVLHRPRQPRP